MTTLASTQDLISSKSMHFLGKVYLLTLESERGQKFCLTEEQWDAVEKAFKEQFQDLKARKDAEPRLDVQQFGLQLRSQAAAPTPLLCGRKFYKLANREKLIKEDLAPDQTARISETFKSFLGQQPTLEQESALLLPPKTPSPAISEVEGDAGSIDDSFEEGDGVEGEEEIEEESDEEALSDEEGDPQVDEELAALERDAAKEPLRVSAKGKGPVDTAKTSSSPETSILPSSSDEQAVTVYGTHSQFSKTWIFGSNRFATSGCTVYSALMLIKLLQQGTVTKQDIDKCLSDGTAIYESIRKHRIQQAFIEINRLGQIHTGLKTIAQWAIRRAQPGKPHAQDGTTFDDIQKIARNKKNKLRLAAKYILANWGKAHDDKNEDSLNVENLKKRVTKPLKKEIQEKSAELQVLSKNQTPYLSWSDVAFHPSEIQKKLIPLKLLPEAKTEEVPLQELGTLAGTTSSAATVESLFQELITKLTSTLSDEGQPMGAILVTPGNSYSLSVKKDKDSLYIQFFNSHGNPKFNDSGELIGHEGPAYVKTFHSLDDFVEFLNTIHRDLHFNPANYAIYPVRLKAEKAAAPSKMESAD